MSPRLSPQILHTKSRLRVLDCSNSGWLTDLTIRTVSANCPLLESLSVAGCTNFQGVSLPKLIQSCLSLTTLVMSGTRVKDQGVMNTDWRLSRISELNILYCHQLTATGLSAMLPKLTRLCYLKCTLTDDTLKLLLPRGYQAIEVLQVHRRYPVTLQYFTRWLSSCPQVTCLDISSIPLDCKHFETFLSKIPRLRILNFAGYEVLGLEKIIFLLTQHCLNLEELSVNFYQSSNSEQLKRGIIVLMERCKNIQKIIVNGLFVRELVAEVCALARLSHLRNDIEIRGNEPFVLPRPRLHIANMVKITEDG